MANAQAESARAIKSECDADLAVALPAINSAVAALNTLTQAVSWILIFFMSNQLYRVNLPVIPCDIYIQDVTIVKSMKNPPYGIKLVMEAICVLKGIKPEKITNKEGKKVLDYWKSSLKILTDTKFLESLINFDKVTF